MSIGPRFTPLHIYRQSAILDHRAADSRRRQHHALPQRHAGAGDGGVCGDGAASGVGGSGAARRPCRGTEPPPAHGAGPVSRGALQQSGGGGAPHLKCKCQRHQGHGVPAQTGGTGHLRVREVRLLHGGNALQGGIRREPRPEKRAVLLVHQPQPLDHRKGNRRIPANF